MQSDGKPAKQDHKFAQFDHDCVKGYIIISRYIFQYFSLYTFIGCIRLNYMHIKCKTRTLTVKAVTALKCCV